MKNCYFLGLLLALLMASPSEAQSSFVTECTWWNQPRCHIGREADNYSRPKCGIIGNKTRACCYQEHLCKWFPGVPIPGCTGDYSVRAFSGVDKCKNRVPTVRKVQVPGPSGALVQQDQYFCCKP